MVAFNLLPWREYTRMRRQLIVKILTLMVGMALLALYFFYPRAPLPLVAPAISDPQQEQIKKIKYVGYLRTQHRAWALLAMPDGKIRDVQAGSHIGKRFSVISLSAAELVLDDSRQHGAHQTMKILLTHS